MANLRSSVSSRNSSLELVRLLAMFMIVFYHLILFFIEPIDPSPIFKAVQIPVHIGVILFVLISGYFGIKRGNGNVRFISYIIKNAILVCEDLSLFISYISNVEQMFKRDFI